MANQSWFQATNYVLEAAGQLQITSAINFDNPITGLTRVQSQTRRFVEMCNSLLQLKRNNRDTVQEFQINTVVGNPSILSTYVYQVDPSVQVESIRYQSFFNITPPTTNSQGSTSTVVAQPLYNVEYREFRQRYPDFTAINTGPPINWIIIPKTLVGGGVGIQQDYIMFFPIPDAIYQIVYQAKLNAVPLQLNTDPVSWSPEYQTVLALWGKAFLEDALSEGKGQGAQYYAEKFTSQYYFWTAGPDELRKAVRTGLKISGPLKGRRVSFYSDTPNSS